MGYLADFVTGRSINEHDKIVAMIIVPATHGHPNPVTGAAKAPVYTADRFEPLSLPMRGKLDEYGYFKPEAGDLGLSILLSTVKAKNWQEFADKGVNELSEPWTFPDPTVFNRENVTAIMPGIAVMHASTFDSLIEGGSYREDAADEPRRASLIVHDAKIRWETSRESQYFNASYMQTPNGRDYTTLGGETIEVPELSRVLGDGDGPASMSTWMKEAIRKRHQKDHEVDGSSLLATYTLLHDFQRAARGLHYLQKYWQPSGYSRGDNLIEVAKFQIADVHAAIAGAAVRFGIEMTSDRDFSSLESIAEQLRAALATAEAEIESVKSNSFKM